MSKKDEKTEGRCPNCGYCPHCGQSKRPPVIPAPYPVPVRPWRPAYPYWGEVTLEGIGVGAPVPRFTTTSISAAGSYS
jgi:hypothetical protein